MSRLHATVPRRCPPIPDIWRPRRPVPLGVELPPENGNINSRSWTRSSAATCRIARKWPRSDEPRRPAAVTSGCPRRRGSRRPLSIWSSFSSRCYNQRRRLKALGIDPTTVAAAVTEGEVPPQVKETIKMANAKKAEAARLRYHRMTADEKKEYNARRTESFRKRREEEEQLLATPAGCISPEGLNKAQVIMHRNARKAESARMRYQKMTPAQRKVCYALDSIIRTNVCSFRRPTAYEGKILMWKIRFYTFALFLIILKQKKTSFCKRKCHFTVKLIKILKNSQNLPFTIPQKCVNPLPST